MTPFYQDEWATIYHADNREAMLLIEAESVDLTVTSPPYDDLRTYQGFEWDFQHTAEQLMRVTKPGGVVVWVVGDQTIDGSETGSSFKQALYFRSLGFNLHDTMIYEKAGLSYPDDKRYYSNFEYMFVFSKGQPKTINLIVDRVNMTAGDKVSGPDRQRDGSLKRKTGEGNIAREVGVRMNVWRIPHVKPTERGFHPATFPIALARDHIRSWSNPGDLILDPFMGSGTTLKAAKDLGIKSIGIEIERKYCEITVERLRQESLLGLIEKGE